MEMFLGSCLLQPPRTANPNRHLEGLLLLWSTLEPILLPYVFGSFYSPLTPKDMVIFGACIWLRNHPKLKLVTYILTITHQCHR